MVVWLDWIIRVVIIGIVVIACILDLTHNRKSPNKYPFKFILVRFFNWLTIGLTYACTYFGRYNLQVLNTTDVHQSMGVTIAQFGVISTCGYITYAVFVVINGYFVDRLGGRNASLIGSTGASIMNIIMGFFLLCSSIKGVGNVAVMCVLFSISDFFQTFCTTAICKVGVYWYHISERGLYSGIFGIIIAFGFYLAFQVNGGIKTGMHYSAIFFFPGLLLAIFTLLTYFFVRSSPEDAGYLPVDEDALAEYEHTHHKMSNMEMLDTTGTGEYVSDDGKRQRSNNTSSLSSPLTTKNYGLPIKTMVRSMLSVIFLFLCVIDFCVGWCRDGVLSYYTMYFKNQWKANESSIAYQLASTGVTIGSMFGSLVAGVVSDRLFNTRRPPVAFIALILYFGFVLLTLFAGNEWMAVVGIGLTSFSFSCVHSIITATCAMDFAGTKATATAVGLLDGIQKIGSSLTGVIMGAIYDRFGFRGWLISLLPAALLGALLLIPILNRKGGKKQVEKERKVEKVGEESILSGDEMGMEGKGLDEESGVDDSLIKKY